MYAIYINIVLFLDLLSLQLSSFPSTSEKNISQDLDVFQVIFYGLGSHGSYHYQIPPLKSKSKKTSSGGKRGASYRIHMDPWYIYLHKWLIFMVN